MQQEKPELWKVENSTGLSTQMDWVQALEWKFYCSIVYSFATYITPDCHKLGYKQKIFSSLQSARNILYYPTLKVVAPPLIAKVRVRLPVTIPPKILAAPNWRSLTTCLVRPLLFINGPLMAPNYEGLDTPLNYAVTHPLSKISGYATGIYIYLYSLPV